MRVAIHIPSQRIIEMQSHAPAGVLITNALAAGYQRADIDEREMTSAQYAEFLSVQPKTAEEINVVIKSELLDIDRASIRAIRESVIAGSPTPQLIALEARATAERAKLLAQAR